MTEDDRRFLRNVIFGSAFLLVLAVCGMDLWQQHLVFERRERVDKIQKEAIERGARVEQALHEILDRLPPQ